MNNQLVSIIVPCYNHAQYLSEALQSVLNQTYNNWECIIINDGSPDNTEEIALEWTNKDSRFLYLKKINGGLAAARNSGIEKADGEYILPLDADNKISKNYISSAIKAFKEDDKLKIVYARAEFFGDKEGIWRSPKFNLKDLCVTNLFDNCALYRKRDWSRVNGYDINMKYGLEDWEFWIAILKNGGSVLCLDEIGFYYRVLGNSMASNLNSDKRKYSYDYISIKHADFFVIQLGSFMELQKEIIKASVYLKIRRKIRDIFFKYFKG